MERLAGFEPATCGLGNRCYRKRRTNLGPSIQIKTHTRYVFRYTFRPVLLVGGYIGGRQLVILDGKGGHRFPCQFVRTPRVKVGLAGTEYIWVVEELRDPSSALTCLRAGPKMAGERPTLGLAS